MPVLVGIFTHQMLPDGRLTDIAIQGNQSTPAGAAYAEIWRNTVATRRFSNQRSASVSDPYDSAHQDEWEHHICQPPARAEMRIHRLAQLQQCIGALVIDAFNKGYRINRSQSGRWTQRIGGPGQ